MLNTVDVAHNIQKYYTSCTKITAHFICRVMADTNTPIPTPGTEEQQHTPGQQPDGKTKDKGKQIMVEP